MRCLHCRKKIGVVRRWVDRQFCCADHRRKASHAYSAREARDLELDPQDAFEDAWLVTAHPPPKKSASFGPGTGILLVVVSVVLVLFLPGGEQRPTAPQSYMPRVGSLGDTLSRAIPGHGNLSLREEFRADLRNWQGDFGSTMRDGWAKTGRSMQIGKLRLWKPTLALADYNLQFETEIEQKAVSWAFRATDRENYYATKIHVSGVGNGSGGYSRRAEIIR